MQWEPLGIDCSKESPWRESDDDYALDDNNNLVPWSWRARDAATFHAQTNTVNELEHKANLKRFRQERKYTDRKIAKQIAKEMEEDKRVRTRTRRNTARKEQKKKNMNEKKKKPDRRITWRLFWHTTRRLFR